MRDDGRGRAAELDRAIRTGEPDRDAMERMTMVQTPTAEIDRRRPNRAETR